MHVTLHATIVWVFLTEAEYAFEQRKRIIPVLTEHGYTADGWLGMILGTKYRYHVASPVKGERELSFLLVTVDKLMESERVTHSK